MSTNPYDPTYLKTALTQPITATNSPYTYNGVGSYVAPYQDQGNTFTWVSSPPTTCSGVVHVFACVHEKLCKCGKTQQACCATHKTTPVNA